MGKAKASDQSACVLGLHAVEAVLKHTPDKVLSISIQQDRDDRRVLQVQQLAKATGISVQRVARQTLDKLAADMPHQGIAAYIKPAQALSEAELESIISQSAKPLVLVLDSVQDPHNLGACLRTAEAAGVDVVIVPRDKAVGLTAVVRKAASGAAELVPFVQVVNLARCLERLQQLGLWVIGTAGDADSDIFSVDFSRPVAVVLGAEGSGLRRLTRERCDELVRIPMRGRVESLNVSVASGVCLFEAVRQRAPV